MRKMNKMGWSKLEATSENQKVAFMKNANISSWVGIFIAALVLYLGVFKTLPQPKLFFDAHALILVGGGTLAATLIALRFKKMEDLGSLFVYGLLLKKTKDSLFHARELLSLSSLAYQNRTIAFPFELTHPYAKEAFELAKKNHIDDTELSYLLKKRNEYFKRSYQSDAKALNAMGKFPPAFGLLGATTGMIAMMSNLGSGGIDQIGSAMAIALVATFWGIALANLLILPLADYASKVASEDQVTRQMIAESIMMIRKDTEPQVVAERLATFLHPTLRQDLKRGIPTHFDGSGNPGFDDTQISHVRAVKRSG